MERSEVEEEEGEEEIEEGGEEGACQRERRALTALVASWGFSAPIFLLLPTFWLSFPSPSLLTLFPLFSFPSSSCSSFFFVLS